MRVIFVTDSYYPKPSPNAICVGKLKDEFEARGIETTVVALRTFPKEDLNGPLSNVIYVEPDFLYGKLYNSTGKTTKNNRTLGTLFKIRGAINGFAWPLMSIPHIIGYLNKLRRLLKEGKNDDTIVIGVYKSLEGALAGALAKKWIGGAKYFLYTLDAVAGSIIPKIYNINSVANHSIKHWEKFLFSTYDYIYLMEAHKTFYSQDRYDWCRDKFRYVDIPLLKNRSVAKQIDSRIKHLVFTGSIASSTADPTYFLGLLEYLKDNNIHADFYGKSFNNIHKKIESSIYATYHGTLSHDEAEKVQENAYALVNFGNNTPCAIPSKIFEYFSTGRPIISFYKIDDDASLPYVSKYRNSLMLDERLCTAENAIKLADFLQQEYEPNTVTATDTFENNKPSTTVDLILRDIYGTRE